MLFIRKFEIFSQKTKRIRNIHSNNKKLQIEKLIKTKILIKFKTLIQYFKTQSLAVSYNDFKSNVFFVDVFFV